MNYRNLPSHVHQTWRQFFLRLLSLLKSSVNQISTMMQVTSIPVFIRVRDVIFSWLILYVISTSFLFILGSDNGPSVPTGLGTDDSDDNRSSCDYHTCNVSDFFISDMIIAGLPMDGNADANVESNPFPDYKCAEPNMLFDVDEYMMLPFLEDTAKSGNTNDVKSHEVATMEPDNGSLYLAINQMKSFNQESEVKANSDQAEHFDPQLLIKYLPELSDASNFQPTPSAKETQRRKSVTLVLDLDGKKIEFLFSY